MTDSKAGELMEELIKRLEICAERKPYSHLGPEIDLCEEIRAAIKADAKEKILMKAQLDKIIEMAGMDPEHFRRMTQA